MRSVAFGERPTIFTDYTTNSAELQKGINRIWSQQGSGAYLLDAVVEVVQGFKKREAKRPVIVAVAAEGRELSYRSYEQVLTPLGDSSAIFYALMVGTPFNDLTDERAQPQRGPRSWHGEHRRQPTAAADADGARRSPQAARQRARASVQVTFARPQSLIPPERQR